MENVDEAFAHAITAGATEVSGVKDQFYGDRSGAFMDPFGHKWTIATHIEDVSVADMNTRMLAMYGGGASSEASAGHASSDDKGAVAAPSSV